MGPFLSDTKHPTHENSILGQLTGYGETAQGNQQVPTATTFFEIGSITKTFAAATWNDKRHFLPTGG